jgi:hypothetical protein
VGKASRAKRERRQARADARPWTPDPKEIQRELDAGVARLRQVLARLPMLQVLANMQAAFMVGYPTGEPPFPMPFALEYVTWLYLAAAEAPEINGMPVSATDWGELEDALSGVLHSALLWDLSRAPGGQETGQGALSFMARTHATYVRAAGYPTHVRDQLISLYAPFDQDLLRLGLPTAETTILIGERLATMLQARVEEEIQRTSAVSRRLIDAFERRDDTQLDAEQAQLLADLRRQGVGRRGLAGMLAQWAVFGLATCYHLDAASVAAQAEVEVDDAERFLRSFSLPFGQPPRLGGRPGVFAEQQRAPLVDVGDGTYLVHLAPYLSHRLRDTLDEKLAGDADCRDRYRAHRAAYLEDHAVRLLASTSDQAQVLRSAKYRFDDGSGETRTYEVDGLVVVDSVLFVVEAKSGRLSDSARLGHGRMAADLGALVADAQKQAARVEKYVRQSQPATFETEAGTAQLYARPDAQVVLVNPTMETLHPFVTQWSELVRAGVVAPEPWVWSVSDNDLRVICEVVENSGQLVHYLHRRREADELNVKAVEELDLFGNLLGPRTVLRGGPREAPGSDHDRLVDRTARRSLPGRGARAADVTARNREGTARDTRPGRTIAVDRRYLCRPRWERGDSRGLRPPHRGSA